MESIVKLVADCPSREFDSESVVIEQDSPAGPLFVLLEGEVEVLRDGVQVAKTSKAGSVFGEMSVLLGVAHTATVRALVSSRFAVIEEPRGFLARSPEACFHVAR